MLLDRSWLVLCLLLCFHNYLYTNATSLCVSRLRFGDEFVNKGGAIATCAEYGATCSEGYGLETGQADDEDELQCDCEVSEILVPCPACSCSPLHPVFNGTSCGNGRISGWRFRNDLIDPHLNHSQALAKDIPFPYPTTVYGWRLRVKNSRSVGGWMLLQVWRPVLGGFNLVASTNFSYDSSAGIGYTDTELPLLKDDCIKVQQGDIIGLYLAKGIKKTAAPFAFGMLSSSVIASGTVHDSSEVLFFTTDGPNPPTRLRTVDYDEHMFQFVINVQAMIGPPVEGEKECLIQPASIETIFEEDTTPTLDTGNLPLNVEYIRLIVLPLLLILLFLILLACCTGSTITCVRCYVSARRSKVDKEEEERGNVSPDNLVGRSVNVKLGSLPRPGSPYLQVPCHGVTPGSCADSALYEAIPELAYPLTASCSGTLPHTYAVLELPPHYDETCSDTVPHFQVQGDIQREGDKSEKRLSTKDELTGQESEEDKISNSDMNIVAEISVIGEHPREREQIAGVGEGIEGDMGWEESISDLDNTEDSDYELQIYNV